MRLLLDEHYSPRIARELRKRGHDVVATVERPDLVSSKDHRLLESAARERRALLTNDVRDYIELAHSWLAEGRHHLGIVLTSDETFPRTSGGIGALVKALDALLKRHPTQDALADQVVWLSPPG